MRLLLDQGLPRSAASALRSQGHDAVHVGEIDLSAADDAIILERARAEGRVVVTLDADFHALLAHAGAERPSVVRIRIARLKSEATVTLLLWLVTHCGAALEAGACVTVLPGRVRVRRLPLKPRRS